MAGCQKLDFSETEEDVDDTPENLTFIGTGEGTMEAPYTVGDILGGKTEKSTDGCWVIGYVVGATYSSIKNAQFDALTYYESNILLASDSMCQDYLECVPVELNTKAMKEKCGLPSNPERWRKCLLVKGTPGLYFKVNGLRRAAAGHWLGQFDIKSILSEPEEWTLDTIPMR